MVNPYAKYVSDTANGNENPYAKYNEFNQNQQPQSLTQARKGSAEQIGAAIAGAADARSLGLGDELGSAMGTPVGYIASKISGSDKSMGQVYDELLAHRRAGDMAIKERNPDSFLTGQVIGAVTGGNALAGTKAAKTLSTGLRSGNILGREAGLAGRAIKQGGAGAAGMGAYEFASGEGSDNRLVRAEEGLVTGLAIGAALPVAGAAAMGAARKLNTRTIVPGAEEIRNAASELYQKADDLGGMLKPEFTNKFIDSVQKLRPQTEIGRMIGGDSAFTQVVNRLSTIRDKPISLRAAQEMDELLGDAIDGFTQMGRLTKEGKKLHDVQTTLRRMIESADDGMMSGSREGFEALKEGRKLWATSRRMDDIERIITRAEMTDNPATAIKTGMRNLYNSKRILGYSPQEARAIERAANSGQVADLLRTAGSRLTPIITAGAGGGVGATATAAAASMAARGAATRAQLKRAGDVSRTIAERSGLVRQEPRVNVRRIAGEARDRILGPNAANELPAPMMALPAPARDILSDVSGVARAATPEEQAAAIALRQRAEELGMSPDVLRAALARQSSELMPMRGQSDLGSAIAGNPNLTLQQIMKMPPAQARKLLKANPKK